MCQAKMILQKKKMADDEPLEIVLSIPGLFKWIMCSIGNLFRNRKKRED